MRIRVENPGAHKSLTEHVMSIADESVEFPGIAQCFGVVGPFSGRMLGVHISPQSTQEEMDTIFANLAVMGGDNVLDWYIVGPCDFHFSVDKAIWKSKGDIKKTFRAAFPKKARFHLMDVTAERSQSTPFGDTFSAFRSIDVRVILNGFSLSFAYKEGSRRSVTQYLPLDLLKFKRL